MEMSSIKDLKAYTLHPIFHPFFLLYWKSVSWIFLLLIVMVVIVVQAPLLPPAPLYHHGSRCEVFYLSTFLIINTVNMTFLLKGGGGITLITWRLLCQYHLCAEFVSEDKETSSLFSTGIFWLDCPFYAFLRDVWPAGEYPVCGYGFGKFASPPPNQRRH